MDSIPAQGAYLGCGLAQVACLIPGWDANGRQPFDASLIDLCLSLPLLPLCLKRKMSIKTFLKFHLVFYIISYSKRTHYIKFTILTIF